MRNMKDMKLKAENQQSLHVFMFLMSKIGMKKDDSLPA
jgi:hypothetical protein